MNSDVILYAGDDVNRFGLLDKNVRKRLMTRNRSKKIGMSACESFPHDIWRIMRDGEIIGSKGHGHLHDTYYFRIRTSPRPESQASLTSYPESWMPRGTAFKNPQCPACCDIHMRAYQPNRY